MQENIFIKYYAFYKELFESGHIYNCYNLFINITCVRKASHTWLTEY